MKKIYLSALLCSIIQLLFSQQPYFPPINNSLFWDTLSPSSLNWCPDKIDSLYSFLQRENTKAFIIAKNGKIVLEKYFGNFTQDSSWYWASAGKTLTSFLVGKAQEENFLSIGDSSSKYLGPGWTNCTPAQEGKISIRNQLTMTTGLDDYYGNPDCTIDTCLVFLADTGSRWAYHNAPYTLLKNVLENATGLSINNYTLSRLKNNTGMTGGWFQQGDNNLYISKPRSMLRFGLLIANNCIWNGDTLLHDQLYKNQMINTSQLLNKSYGYLWWLNGKGSFMLPTLQNVFQGSWAPDAPADMYAALGKNGQILSISPSNGLVFIRMGESPNAGQSGVTTFFCNNIWKKITELNCAVLTISSLNVKAFVLDSIITLNWNASNSNNIRSFSVEKSYNSRDFINAAMIYPSSANAGDFNYKQKIEWTNSAIMYFRIKQINNNNTFQYSNVVKVATHQKTIPAIFPNPSSGKVFIYGKDIHSVRILDASGKPVISLYKHNRISSLPVDITHLAKGIYIVNITDGNNTLHVQKLMVQ